MIGFIYRIAGVYIWTVTKFGGLHLGTVIISGTHEIWHKEKNVGFTLILMLSVNEDLCIKLM